MSRIFLLLALLLAFALRVHDLGSQSLWYDEAVTAQVAQQGLPELARWTADDIQPPLYYAITAGWVQLAGLSEWALRFPSAVYGVLMVALAWALGRRLFGRPAGELAALLAALHPLWIYYSQEARMYTLLTALGMAAGYALLRVLAARHGSVGYPKTRLRWWFGFSLAAIALLYTHYFALFLLVAFALHFLISLLARPSLERRRLLLEGSIASLAILLAWLPWLPNVLRRFGEDASYWRGALKLNEALRHIAISFSTGETVLEQQAIPLAWAVAALALLCLAALLWAAAQDRQRLLSVASSLPQRSSSIVHRSSIRFVLLYLCVPIAAILLLSYSNPKFNPRYLMLASPGLLLLLAGGLALPWRPPFPTPHSPLTINHSPFPINHSPAPTPHSPSPTPHSPSPTPHSPLTINHSPFPINHSPAPTPHSPLTINHSPFPINHSPLPHSPRLLSLLAILTLLTIFAFSLRNWFTDPAFTKDDWRGAVAYVKSQLQPDEAVVLVSGHAYPAWHYYAPDIAPLRLPEIETLDVNAVLDLGAAEALNQGLAGRSGAWLVQWQDQVVDPNSVVPFLLDTAGDAQPGAASFWGLGSPQHYRFFDAVRAAPDAPGAAFPTELPLSAAYQGQQLDLNFANQVELLGYSQPPCPQPICPLYLFWRSPAPLAADLKLTATLFDPNAQTPASQPLDRRLAAYEYPTFRWRPGEVVLSKLEIPADRGTPPGDYRLRLGVYDAATGQALDVLDEAGAPQGQWAWLAPVVIGDLVTDGPGGPPPGSQPLALAPEITLQGLSIDRTEVEPLDAIQIEAWWQATAPPEQDYRLGYTWSDPAGQIAGGGWLAPAGTASFPTSRWPVGAPVRGRLNFAAPGIDQPGVWALHLGLLDARSEDPTAGFAGASVDLPITVLPSSRRFEPSAPFDLPSDANFDFQVQLLGARLGDEPPRAGAWLPVTVGWQAMQPMERSFTGFVHLLDAAGQIVAQDDHLPLQGQRPTDAWLAGEVVEDLYQLALPAELAAGEYWLEVGLYDASRPGLPRLGAPALLGPISIATD
ncbi:MAG: glycosyltransferase family 39 protein [Anaerolineae bacterium]